MKNTFKIRMLAAATVAMLVSAPAFAQWTVNVNSDISPTTIERNLSLTAINGELATMNAQIRSTDTYLQGGYNGGNGLLPLLSSINEKLGRSNSSESEMGSINDTASRSRIYEEKMIDLKAAGTPSQADFRRACVAISSRMTSSQGHGAARGAADTFQRTRFAALPREERIKAPGTPTQKLADLVRDRNTNGFCSKEDMQNGFPGCSIEGNLPNADIRSSSLTAGATTNPSEPTNGSLDAEQQAAARAFMANVSAAPPRLPTEAALATNDGQRFLTVLNQFASRQAVADDALGNILSSHEAMPLTVNGQQEQSPIMKDWQMRKNDWSQIFGSKMKFPDAPSERDLLRYEVFRYYTSGDYQRSLQVPANDHGLTSLAREQLAQTAVTNRLLFQLLERQEDTNKILATLLHQQMNPLSTESLNAASQEVGR